MKNISGRDDEGYWTKIQEAPRRCGGRCLNSFHLTYWNLSRLSQFVPLSVYCVLFLAYQRIYIADLEWMCTVSKSDRIIETIAIRISAETLFIYTENRCTVQECRLRERDAKDLRWNVILEISPKHRYVGVACAHVCMYVHDIKNVDMDRGSRVGVYYGHRLSRLNSGESGFSWCVGCCKIHPVAINDERQMLSFVCFRENI